MCSRGSQPSWIACRVMEKAPVMIAWLAMIVATVARHDERNEQRLRAQAIKNVVWRSTRRERDARTGRHN